MRLFSSPPLILLLLVVWPVMLFTFVFACAWLERSTLAGGEREHRPQRPSAAPEQSGPVRVEQAPDLATGYWAPPATGNGVANGVAAAEQPTRHSAKAD